MGISSQEGLRPKSEEAVQSGRLKKKTRVLPAGKQGVQVALNQRRARKVRGQLKFSNMGGERVKFH